MINSSILNGVYPSKLKMAKIVPVYKADDDTDVNNYRPISLLSHFDRIFEKMIKRRMESFIEQKDLLSSSQYGFRKAHSTQHAILDIVNAIQTNMDKHSFSCGVFIDLKKAFDTVDHNILLPYLDHYGFRGVINKWFSSYLLGRTQSTQIGPRLVKLQKRVVRIIDKSHFNAHSDPIFKKLGILKFHDLNLLQLGQFMFSYQIRTLPPKLASKFTLNSQIHTYYSRNSHAFRLPFCRTNIKQFSVFYQGPKFCNSLDIDINNSSSTASFKKALKSFFFNNYSEN